MPNNWTWSSAPYDTRDGIVRTAEVQQDPTQTNQSIFGSQNIWNSQPIYYSSAVLTQEMLSEAANRVIHQGLADAYDMAAIQRLQEATQRAYTITNSWFDTNPVYYPMPKLKTKSKLPAWF